MYFLALFLPSAGLLPTLKSLISHYSILIFMLKKSVSVQLWSMSVLEEAYIMPPIVGSSASIV